MRDHSGPASWTSTSAPAGTLPTLAAAVEASAYTFAPPMHTSCPSGVSAAPPSCRPLPVVSESESVRSCVPG